MSEDKEKQISVLFADDDEGTLQMLAYEGRDRGWHVETATSVSEIIDKVNEFCINKDQCFDAIVADLHYFSNPDEHYPKLTGVTAARSIRKVYEDIPIIFVTGYSNTLINKQAEKYSNEIIQKPVDLMELFSRIEFYIHWHNKNRCISKGNKSNDLLMESPTPLVTINSIIVDSINTVRDEIKYAGKE